MENTIIILYYSKHNNTKMLAKRIYDIFREFIPETLQVEMMDATQMNFQALKDAVGYIIGTPDYFDYMSGYIKLFFDEMYDFKENLEKKPAFVFVSHGGGGKAGKKLFELCEAMKLIAIAPVISVKENNISSKIESQILKNCQEMVKILKN